MKRPLFAFLLYFISAVMLLPQGARAQSLVAHYPLGDTGTTVKDFSNCGNNGTAANVFRTADRFGLANAADSFNGTSSQITVNDAATLRPATISVSAWVKRASLGGDRKIAGKNLNGTISDSYNLGIYNDNKLEFWIYYGGNWHGVRGLSGGATIGTGTWYHVVGVYDGNVVTTYVNGAVDRTIVTGFVQIDYNAAPLYIGQTPTGEYFHGCIDDVRIYDYALEYAEIQRLYNGSKTITAAPVSPPLSISGSGIVRYDCASACRVSLKYYDLRGRLAATLVDRTQGAGSYVLSVREALPARGLYIRVFQAGAFVKRDLTPVTGK